MAAKKKQVKTRESEGPAEFRMRHKKLRGNWSEPFYFKHIKIVKGECLAQTEKDRDLLLGRGFDVIDDRRPRIQAKAEGKRKTI